jgi:hypothetical protein
VCSFPSATRPGSRPSPGVKVLSVVVKSLKALIIEEGQFRRRARGGVKYEIGQLNLTTRLGLFCTYPRSRVGCRQSGAAWVSAK